MRQTRPWYLQVISGEGRGLSAMVARGLLSAAEWVYRRVVVHRNRRYDRHERLTTWLERPVISVGNITTGGVGKTPMAVWLAQRLIEMGRRPAIVCRGYKAPGGDVNEEMQMVSRQVPRAVCIANPHRIAAAEFAIAEQAANVVLMDDGFQHRALGRLLDIVLVDATCPFGYGRVLPRGLLREPIEGLARADLIAVTRCDQVAPGELAGLVERISRVAPGTPVVRCVHRVTAVTDLEGHQSDTPMTLSGRAVCFAAVGNPRAFAESCRQIGYEVVGRVWWPDHHHYGVADAREVMSLAGRAGADVLLTTAKDGIKLVHLPVEWSPPVRVVRVDIAFLDDGATIMLGAVKVALETFERPTDAAQLRAD